MQTCDCCGEDVNNVIEKVRVVTLNGKTFEVVDFICSKCIMKEHVLNQKDEC